MKNKKHFKYISGAEKQLVWMLYDLFPTKKSYKEFVRQEEKELSKLIDDYLSEKNVPNDLFNYFIVCDKKKVIPFVSMWDDINLIFETFAVYSEYYTVIELFDSNGLCAFVDRKFIKTLHSNQLPLKYKDEVINILHPSTKKIESPKNIAHKMQKFLVEEEKRIKRQEEIEDEEIFKRVCPSDKYKEIPIDNGRNV